MPDAWDGHAHVIGDSRAYPFWPGRGYTPDPAPLDDYLAMLDRHDLARGVLVQPSVYGFDNRCLLDSLDRAAGRLVGIAVPAPDATTRDLEDLHRRGIRGVRCNQIDPGGLSPGIVAGWRPALVELGWHVELQIAVEETADLAAFIGQFGVPVVIDHMGRPTPGRTDPSSPYLRGLIGLVRAGACHVKLSAPYRLSREGPPWHDVMPLARALVDADPSGCLWGTDWPHVNTTPPIDTGDVFLALGQWCPDLDTRRTITIRAASALFGMKGP